MDPLDQRIVVVVGAGQAAQYPCAARLRAEGHRGR